MRISIYWSGPERITDYRSFRAGMVEPNYQAFCPLGLHCVLSLYHLADCGWAAARIIFYTNTDVDRFLNARVIFENFEIERDATRIHHPTAEDKDRRYRAIHYTVRLKEDRAKLPEYSRFNGMRCEIQVHTIL